MNRAGERRAGHIGGLLRVCGVRKSGDTRDDARRQCEYNGVERVSQRETVTGGIAARVSPVILTACGSEQMFSGCSQAAWAHGHFW